MSEKPERLENESAEYYNRRLEKWYCETGNVTYLVREGHTFNSYPELSEAAKGWETLTKYVNEKGQIMKLRFHEEAENKWLIQTVPLVEIGVVMLRSRARACVLQY